MHIIESIVNLVYPTTCGICGKIYKEEICPRCMQKISKIMKNKIEYKNNLKHIYLFKYKGIIREKIIDYKFNNKAYLYKTFAKIILKNKKICGILKSYDIIIPVPISKKRKIKRGYNQTELIAKYIANNVENLQCEVNIVKKQKEIVPQSTLTRQERIKNVEGAYMVQEKSKIADKKIIIFDDVYTTGSTTTECQKILKQAGAKVVDVLTIAKD